MFLKKANIDDIEDVWKWYSDPISRKMSIYKKRVDFKSHCNWFKDSLKDPNKTMYIGYKDQSKIGLSRFDFSIRENYTFVSITLDTNFRGKNLSKKFLQISINKFLKEKKTVLKAKIKKNNIASINCFKSCSFELLESNDKFQIYVQNKQ
tara:strand:- start:4009 stop:4458 length:450 start_codon:yes stop_codon:yes gene_type:complete